jgi:hypothetical protein
METFLSVLFGGFITFVAAFLIEYLRKPKLRLSIEQPHLDRTDDSGKVHTSRHLRLRLHNDVSSLFAPWMLRASAVQCRGAITFHHLNDGQNVFDRSMAVRWSNSAEPLTNVGLATTPVTGLFPSQPAPQIFKFALTSRIDVYAGEEELLDVAVRFQGEKDCYGWNNEAYLYNWRAPHWKLGPGRYLVRVVITSSGQSCKGVFRLVNDVESLGDFRLIDALPEDRWSVYDGVPPKTTKS